MLQFSTKIAVVDWFERKPFWDGCQILCLLKNESNFELINCPNILQKLGNSDIG